MTTNSNDNSDTTASAGIPATPEGTFTPENPVTPGAPTTPGAPATPGAPTTPADTLVPADTESIFPAAGTTSPMTANTASATAPRETPETPSPQTTAPTWNTWGAAPPSPQDHAEHAVFLAPGQVIPTPNQTTPAPNQTTPAPNQTTPTPNQTTPTPNQTTPTPNQTTPTPFVPPRYDTPNRYLTPDQNQPGRAAAFGTEPLTPGASGTGYPQRMPTPDQYFGRPVATPLPERPAAFPPSAPAFAPAPATASEPSTSDGSIRHDPNRPGSTAYGASTTTPLAPVSYNPYAPASTRRKTRSSRSGRLIALGVGVLLVGAFIGGASAAGITALLNNGQKSGITTSGGTTSNIVVNRPESANQTTAVAAKASPSVVTLSVTGSSGTGTGSGIVLSADGYVLTNTHVVTLDGAESRVKIEVTTNNGHLYSATIVGTDPLADLAVVKLDGANNLTPMDFADSNKLNVGDQTVAIGAPLGLSGTVTTGIVSALNRSINVASSAAPTSPDSSQQSPQDNGPYDFYFGSPNNNRQQPQAQNTVTLPVIQTDAAINPGNSGGPLLNDQGQLIGVNVAIQSTGGSGSSQAGNIGVGFALPSNLAQRISKELITSGKASHGLLGASIKSATASKSNVVGALIQSVTSGGAAEKAGLKVGDIVTQFNGYPITGPTDLTAQVRALAGGATATVAYVRDGATATTEVTVSNFTG